LPRHREIGSAQRARDLLSGRRVWHPHTLLAIWAFSFHDVTCLRRCAGDRLSAADRRQSSHLSQNFQGVLAKAASTWTVPPLVVVFFAVPSALSLWSLACCWYNNCMLSPGAHLSKHPGGYSDPRMG
jgi:hypothetical protein